MAQVYKELVLTREGEDDLLAPTLAQLHEAVDALSPDDGCGFLILVADERDYAQAAGGDGAYTVEWREHPDGDFRHWMAGRFGKATARTIEIATSCAHVTVQENERLNADEVKAILAAFHRGELRPKGFAWREITEQFE